MKQNNASEENIINYITGEMNEADARKFESRIHSETNLKAKVEEMQSTLDELRIWSDAEISIPPVEKWDIHSSAGKHGLVGSERKLHLPGWMRYAAAFLGFAILWQISGLRLTHQSNTLMLSVGDPELGVLKNTDVDALVEEAIADYALQQNQVLEQFKNDMSQNLSEITVKVDRIDMENQLTVTQLEDIFNRNLDKQYVNLESMIKGIEDMQRQELEDSFTGLVEYIENKRVKDQFKIQNAFNEIATAINNQQNQTSALLSSISEEPPILKSY